MRRFLLVGLTGGIATGKSTVTALLAGPSVRVVDADALAREVVAPGTPAHAQIVAEFGTEVLQLASTEGEWVELASEFSE